MRGALETLISNSSRATAATNLAMSDVAKTYLNKFTEALKELNAEENSENSGEEESDIDGNRFSVFAFCLSSSFLWISFT